MNREIESYLQKTVTELRRKLTEAEAENAILKAQHLNTCDSIASMRERHVKAINDITAKYHSLSQALSDYVSIVESKNVAA
jgi:hypothetical protein